MSKQEKALEAMAEIEETIGLWEDGYITDEDLHRRILTTRLWFKHSTEDSE